MKRYLKKAVPLLYVLPFVIGSIGYRIAGETITDSCMRVFFYIL